eukprot:s38_g36.t1
MTTHEGQSLVWSWVKSPSCLGVFCAPPCGTCSKARGIPVRLPNGVVIPGPQPLRTESEPNGVAKMSHINRLRVSSANTLYHFITQICLFCIEHDLVVVIENPRSSLYWRTSFFKPLLRFLKFTAHQACAYGSDRPKWTVLAHNTRTLVHLNHVCPGVGPQHHHKPWGVVQEPGQPRKFSTAEETAYPLPLAYNIAFYIAHELILRGWKPPAVEFQSPDTVSYQHLRAVVGVQPKASKVPPLLAEFGHVISIKIPLQAPLPVQPGQKLSSPWKEIPTGSCLLKKPPLRLNGGDVTINACPPDTPSKLVFFGVYRTCEEFVKAAVCAGHPIDSAAKLPETLTDVVKFLRENSMSQLAKHRHATLSHWLTRGKDLVKQEAEFHNNLHSDLQGILAPKRLLLWKEMMEFYDYPDRGVFDEVVTGVDLAGPAPFVESFDPSFKPAVTTVGELAEGSKANRYALLSSVRSSGDPELDAEVFSKTLAELECGWLSGPFELSDLPPDAIVSRRFGIKQTSGEIVKVRLIDDFSASGVNSTVQVETASKLHTLDVAAALCLELLKLPGSHQWLGKTIDLSAAYRQLGVAPTSRWVSYIAVYDPSANGPKIFSMRALPFGASRSVYGFLRVAHSLWWLGCVALKLAWSNFFDDFITLAREAESKTVDIAAAQFFKLLGWEVASGDKDKPFAMVFKALGVEIDCTECRNGRVMFSNTQKRVSELVSSIDHVLQSRSMTTHEAQVMRGRMQFAKSQIFGRSARLCLGAVTSHAFSDTVPDVSERTISALACFKASLLTAKPREVTPSWNLPMFLFTDASFSPEDKNWPCGLGGVLVDSLGNQVAAMSFCLNASDLEVLGYPPKQTVIFEAELLALLVCLKLWSKLLKHRPCVAYVDNNSTRDVAISGVARTSPGLELVSQLLDNEDRHGMLMWFARVPSSSNIADGPSRDDATGITAKFVSRDLVRLVTSKCLSAVSKIHASSHAEP